jgi:peptidoglycan/xylan/chitin deacetylase (PgdA/CDA1 family)
VSIVAAALLTLVLVAFGLRTLARSRTVQLFSAPVARIATPDSVVALTFDDGPTEQLTDSLIRLLRSRNVRATFFVMGAEVARAPDAARALVAAGHELGNHSYTHKRMILRRPSDLRHEIERTDSLLRAAGMQGPIYFRPPYSYKLVTLPYVLWRMGRTTVTWDVEPDSYAEVAATPEGIVRHVLERVRPGSIILLHPWYPSRATSLAALPMMIDSLRARGYRFTTVGDLRDRRRAGS